MTTLEEMIVDRLRTAVRLVDAAAVPEQLHGAALVLAYRGLDAAENSTGALLAEPTAGLRGSPVAVLAQRLGVDDVVAERVFDIDEDGAHLVVPRSSLDPRKAPAMRDVALLVAAGRQAVTEEEWTGFGIIREACDGRGVLDPVNFAAEVRKLDGNGVRVRGAGRDREMKVNAAGFELAGAVVRKIVETLARGN